MFGGRKIEHDLTPRVHNTPPRHPTTPSPLAVAITHLVSSREYPMLGFAFEDVDVLYVHASEVVPCTEFSSRAGGEGERERERERGLAACTLSSLLNSNRILLQSM